MKFVFVAAVLAAMIGAFVTAVELPPSPGFPFCQVCGAGQVVTIPDGIVLAPGTDQTDCATIQYGGFNGYVDPEYCPVIFEFLFECDCMPGTAPTATITVAPVVAATIAPVIPPVVTPDPLAPVSSAPLAVISAPVATSAPVAAVSTTAPVAVTSAPVAAVSTTAPVAVTPAPMAAVGTTAPVDMTTAPVAAVSTTAPVAVTTAPVAPPLMRTDIPTTETPIAMEKTLAPFRTDRPVPAPSVPPMHITSAPTAGMMSKMMMGDSGSMVMATKRETVTSKRKEMGDGGSMVMAAMQEKRERQDGKARSKSKGNKGARGS